MNINKRFCNIAIAILVVIILFIVLFKRDKFTMDDYQNCTLAFWNNGEDVVTQISDEDGKTIYNILLGQEMYKEDFYCGFGDDISIRFNDESVVIQLAQDGCGHLYSVKDNQYIAVDDENRQILYDIFKKYGSQGIPE